jgi:hypothetical protein
MSLQHDATVFISGMLAAGFLVAVLFFVKFRRQTGDRLFSFFAAAFALLFAQRVMLAFAPHASVHVEWFYLIRLLAFLLIIAGIVDKNRAARE